MKGLFGFRKLDMYMGRVHKRRLWSIIALFACAIYAVAGAVGGTTFKTYAAEPKVMVTDYSISGDSVTAGENFELSVTIKNTATKAVSNMKVSVYAENGEFIPEEGAGTVYIKELKADSEETLTFAMKTITGLEEKTYKLMVKNEYEDRYSQAYTVTDTLYIPVVLTQRVSVTDRYVSGGAVLGEAIESTGSINNPGTGKHYNVSVEIESDYVEPQTSYVGNIEPGKSGSVDLISKAVRSTPGNADGNIKMKVSYEDQQGKVKYEEHRISIQVQEPVYSNVEKIKEEQPKVDSRVVTCAALGAVVVVIFIVMGARKRLRKRRNHYDEGII